MEIFCYFMIFSCFFVSSIIQFCELEDFHSRIRQWDNRDEYCINSCKWFKPSIIRDTLVLKVITLLMNIIGTVIYFVLCIIPIIFN
jgi:hypothetical protein